MKGLLLSAEEFCPISPITFIRSTQNLGKIKQFRRSVRDVLKPEHNDHFLLRWLRGNFLPIVSYLMFHRSMRLVEVSFFAVVWAYCWNMALPVRVSTLGLEEVKGLFLMFLEASLLVIPFVGLDVWGLLHAVTRTDIIRMVLLHLENYLSLASKQAQTHGANALKVTVLFDLEGFNMRQYAWKPAAELVFSLLQIYEANYPEILKICFIVNAPKVFSLAFNVIKKFMDEYTLSKIRIYGSDAKKWQAQVLTVIDKDQLPQHYGGSMVDENGDPKCSSIVKPGGKVSKKFYARNVLNESKKEYTKVTVKTGEKHCVDLLCADGDSVLKWEFGVDSHDIKFSIKRRDQDGNESIVHDPKKVSEGPMEVGVLSCSGPATYTIIFDNKGSFLRNKKVYYDIIMTMPERDLNMSDDPEDLVPSGASMVTATP
ncbi:jg19153 [Pararge aegeria aegeria]|uniref:Jg19153 protein n=1 Tax=Pararge aegeria aegeria TaxID=348720 RepID=A0A8S4R6R6_9NEOP|nr:jg19153 [Pararge aegeria aegeria]